MLLQKCLADPLHYAKHILGVEWWSKQVEIVEALLKHKRVIVKAGNGPGKTFLAGGLANWFYDCHNPGVCISTAPSSHQVTDVLWKEVRRQRKGRGGFQPKAPRLESAADHYAEGITAATGDAFQGRHEQALFLIFDEATGIHQQFFDAGEGMQPLYWLIMLNPTDTSSYAYQLEYQGGFHVISLDSLLHPNIIEEAAGRPAPYPNSSLRLGWLEARLKAWCEEIQPSEKKAADFIFRDRCYRPGPLFEARVLGRWPSQGSTSVWSDAMWQVCQVKQEIDIGKRLVLGCDKARFGDDYTSIFVRRGNCLLHHETHNGWDNNQISGRLKQLCRAYAGADDPKRVLCHVDDVQGGVIDLADGFNFVCINSSNKAIEEEAYPNKRSELWFATAERANEGRVDLSRLSAESLNLLRTQVMAPTWKVDAQGRRVVEPKSDTKKRVSRSPDDADALNLAFYGDGSDLTAALAVSRAGVQRHALPELW